MVLQPEASDLAVGKHEEDADTRDLAAFFPVFFGYFPQLCIDQGQGRVRNHPALMSEVPKARAMNSDYFTFGEVVYNRLTPNF